MKFTSAYLRSVVLPLALLPLGYSITNTRTATTLYRGQELNSHGKIKIHAPLILLNINLILEKSFTQERIHSIYSNLPGSEEASDANYSTKQDN